MQSPIVPAPPLDRPGVPRPALGDRRSFPQLRDRAYLGHAAISPSPLAVQQALLACWSDTAAGGAAAYPIWDLQRQRLRRTLERFLNAEVDEVALTPGTTRGISDLALGLPFHSGETVLGFVGEFPANVTPWQRAASAFGVELRLLPAPEPRRPDAVQKVLDDTEAALQRGARYLTASAVQFQTGFLMPLRELGALCRKYGALFLVDAIQALGVIQIDVKACAIDALSGGAHKWLLGLEGAGYLYVSSELSQRLRPLTAGWTSHEEGESFLFRGKDLLRYDRPLKSNARVFEGSSANAVGFAAMEAGVDICRALGAGAIFEHVQRYLDAVEPAFESRGFRSQRALDESARSCILSFELPEGLDIVALARELRSRGIFASTPDGLLRLAPHFANSEREIADVVGALDEVLAVLRPGA